MKMQAIVPLCELVSEGLSAQELLREELKAARDLEAVHNENISIVITLTYIVIICNHTVIIPFV